MKIRLLLLTLLGCAQTLTFAQSPIQIGLGVSGFTSYKTDIPESYPNTNQDAGLFSNAYAPEFLIHYYVNENWMIRFAPSFQTERASFSSVDSNSTSGVHFEMREFFASNVNFSSGVCRVFKMKSLSVGTGILFNVNIPLSNYDSSYQSFTDTTGALFSAFAGVYDTHRPPSFGSDFFIQLQSGFGSHLSLGLEMRYGVNIISGVFESEIIGYQDNPGGANGQWSSIYKDHAEWRVSGFALKSAPVFSMQCLWRF
jgi:hypothetical protein